ncbi:MAG: chorismate mutase [Acidobacteria bacterium]|nr:chorismate mutase [Acidobacteriota bacterium]
MNIKALRQEIDKLDRELVKLLNRRAKFSLAVGRLKQKDGLPLFILKREQEIARNVCRANRGPLPNHALKHLYEQLLQHTRAMVREALRAERRNANAGLKAGAMRAGRGGKNAGLKAGATGARKRKR